MREVRVSREALGALVRAGRLKMGRTASIARVGFVMRAANTTAASGLKKAAESASDAGPIQFPLVCCNCMAEHGVRPMESRSTVNRGVAYEFRLPIPHCRACADTANRKRPGSMGLIAAFLAISVPVGIAMLAFGAASNRDWLIMSSFVVAPLAGFLLPRAWIGARRPRAGQSSRYQAVFASGVDVGGAGAANGFTLTFENGTYARRFLDLNKKAGVAGT